MRSDARVDPTVLREELSGWQQARVSGRLLIVNSVQACARYGAAFEARAGAGLSDLALLPMDDALLLAAARLEPPGLRPLDAIHLATALSIRDRVGVLFCYDDRLADAAQSAGSWSPRPGTG